MTQEELNHKQGMADRLMSKWECGTRTPLAYHLYCWADALQGRLVFLPFDEDNTVLKKKLKRETSNDNPMSWQDLISSQSTL